MPRQKRSMYLTATSKGPLKGNNIILKCTQSRHLHHIVAHNLGRLTGMYSRLGVFIELFILRSIL